MFIKYMNEDVSFDSLAQLDAEISNIKSDIENCETQIAKILHGEDYAFGRYNIGLLSEDEITELRELQADLQACEEEEHKLFWQYHEEILDGYDEDGHKEYSIHITDKDLAAELEPKVEEIRKKSNALRTKIANIEGKIEALSREAADKKALDLDIQSKKTALSNKQAERSDMIKNIIAINDLEWVADSFCSEVNEISLEKVTVVNTEIRKAADGMYLYVDLQADFDLSTITANELSDSAYSEPYLDDSYADDFIENLKQIDGVIFELDNSDTKCNVECIYIDSAVNNTTDVEVESEEETYENPGYWGFEVDGSFTVTSSFKLKLLR